METLVPDSGAPGASDARALTTPPDPPDPTRRRLLASFVTGSVALMIPFAWAVPVTDAAQGTFAALSAILVGRKMLNAGLTRRMHAALLEVEPGLDGECQALLKIINEKQIDPAKLQAVLDKEHSNLAALPRKIMRAWCLGLVGEGEATRCIAYENAMDAVMVSDVLKPPTYAYGPYGSWSNPPNGNGGSGDAHT